jgi:PAS domain-containing protein
VSGVWIASLLYLTSAGISLATVAAILRRRDARGARALAGMLMAAAVWAACDAIEVHLATVEGHRFISQIQYLGVVSAAPFFAEAALALGRLDAWLRRPLVRIAIWAVPIVSLLMAWTSAWHEMLWTRIVLPEGDALFARFEYGWWFWILMGQHYLLMLAGAGVLLSARRRVSSPFRTPMLGVVVAVGIAWVGNAVYVFKLGPYPGLNWLTLSLGLSGALLAWLVVREGLLDLVPRAREALLETMTDAVLVLDLDDRIIFHNQPALDLLRLAPGARELPASMRLPDIERASTPWLGEVALDDEGAGRRWLDVRVDRVPDRWGNAAGRLVVGRDITTRKALEGEREALIAELRSARGAAAQPAPLLTVCAYCQRVRDEAGAWTSVTAYLERRAPITHGICADCYQSLHEPQPASDEESAAP